MHSKSKGYNILFFALLGVFASGFVSCKKDLPQVEEPKPFVRLLKNQQFKSNLLHRDIDYAVMLPVEYEDTTKSFPVVYLLHGWGDDETAWYIDGLIQYYVDQNAETTVPMIYVMPSCFNSYYMNKHNGQYPLMDMFVNELVPLVDSLFRTKNDPTQRSVMGYSMGGYGAMILPVKNPDVFKTGVSLSMSFRTNEQYINETQSVFDYQWAPIFGGSGISGEARFTEYFKQNSPFQFLQNTEDQSMMGLNLFFDCGDDEESLSETNNELHALLRNRGIPHEYRMRSGYHNWDYWKKSLPEALKYITYAVQKTPYPTQSEPVNYGEEIQTDKILEIQLENNSQLYRIVLPANYANETVDYPVILTFHESELNVPPVPSNKLLSLLNNQILETKLPPSILVEVPVSGSGISLETAQNIIDELDANYRTSNNRNQWLMIGNRSGGRIAYDLIPHLSEKIHACLLFDAQLADNPTADTGNLVYYLDICDEGQNYISNNALYLDCRKNSIPHEYRVRQGLETYADFLNGLFEAISFIKKNLKV
ncbi:MAG: alpha/beta hydrolase-fold protein [Bacteroidales bacterium]